MARPKKPNLELRSLDECNEALRELLLATTNLESLQASRDTKVAEVTASYEGPINWAIGRRDDLTTALQHYYMTHLADIERDGRKSLQLANGVIGRRLSPPALKLRNKSWTWRVVLVKLQAKFGTKYLRKRDPEVDKDAVKAEMSAEDLESCGLKVEQDETFFAEPARPPAVVEG
jgi:phage host-nuclease inhibitor protein Gam